MNCPMENRADDELLLNYVSGALDSERAAQFEQHMHTCAACAKFAREQKAVWGALNLFEAAPVSAGFDRTLYQRMEQVSWWDRIVAAFRSPLLGRRGLPIAAATAGLLVAGYLWQRPEAPAPKSTAPLSAEAEGMQPEQVQHALDD